MAAWQKISSSFLVFVLLSLSSCTPSTSGRSQERAEVVEWASQLANIEKRAELVVEKYDSLMVDTLSHQPSQTEYEKLSAIANEFSGFYNELNNLYSPLVAREVQSKWVESFAEQSNSMVFYLMAIRLNDISYIEKSRLAAQNGNKMGSDAYTEFEILLEKYSISCQEIDFCE